MIQGAFVNRLPGQVTITAVAMVSLLGSPIVTAHDGEERSVSAPLILGVLEFPNSGAEAAQEPFEKGVMLLHAFEFSDAPAAASDSWQELDAIWQGETVTLRAMRYPWLPAVSTLTTQSAVG